MIESILNFIVIICMSAIGGTLGAVIVMFFVGIPKADIWRFFTADLKEFLL